MECSNSEKSKIINLSIEKWGSLAKQNVAIPIRTVLYGVSMEPLIRCQKDCVTIVPLSRSLMIGDIVLFERTDGKYVVHRVYQINEDTIQTWGDNCRFPDKEMPLSSVLGLVVSMNKNGRIVSLDSEAQRRYGIDWMHGGYRRRLWYIRKKVRSCIGSVMRLAGRLVHMNH